MTVVNPIALYEGEGRGGAPLGFGRLIRDLKPLGADVQDNFIGYQGPDGTAAGKYVYFNNFQLVHWGYGVGNEYTEAPENQDHFSTFVMEQ